MGPKQRNTGRNTNNSAEDETEPTDQSITTAQLEKILADNRKENEKIIKDTIQNEFASMKQELTRLQSELECVTGVADNALKLSEQLKKDFTKLQDDNVNLKTRLQNSISDQQQLLEVVEDNKNRQLRKTLVFKGIPEQKFQSVNAGSTSNADSAPLRSENWDDTATILAKSMSETLNTSEAEARQMVERCHRGAPNPNYHGSAPRPIFAAFIDWRDSERTKDAFRKAKNGVFADQKVGPRTTKRRDMALKERKRLIEQSIIYNGYVAHPARLMVKDTLVRGAKYKMFKDFSKEPVMLR